MTRLARRSSLAAQDFYEIGLYIAQDSLDAAGRVLDGLDAKIQLLVLSPDMGRSRPELAPGVRSFSADSYVIFYRRDEDGIEIIRVLHGARDVNKFF
jgi:toxin ParE1/3/4